MVDQSNPICLTAIGNTLYFNAYDQTNGAELWKSDGTTSGTVMVKDIGSGSSSGNPTCSGMSMPVLGSTLYFTADDGTNGNELWKSDGTASGTVMVKDINAVAAAIPMHTRSLVTPFTSGQMMEPTDMSYGYPMEPPRAQRWSRTFGREHRISRFRWNCRHQ